jgi:hypothetical protein
MSNYHPEELQDLRERLDKALADATESGLTTVAEMLANAIDALPKNDPVDK